MSIYKIDNIADLPAYLRCKLCGDIFSSPTRLNCSHTFCKDCVEVWMLEHKNCAECGKKILMSSISADLVASTLVNELIVSCAADSCMWNGRLEFYKDHNCVVKELKII